MAHFGGLDDDEDDHDEDAFGGDDEGGHEDGHRQQFSSKALILFLVDCHENMHIKYKFEDGEFQEEVTYFQRVCKHIHAFVREHIKKGQADHVGLVFYNSEEIDNPWNHESCKIELPLKELDQQTVTHLGELASGRREVKWSTRVVDDDNKSHLDLGLWCCTSMFSKDSSPAEKNARKGIYILTCNDSLVGGSFGEGVKAEKKQKTAEDECVQRVKDSVEKGILVDVWPLNDADSVADDVEMPPQFKPNDFFKRFLEASIADLGEDSILAASKEEEIDERLHGKSDVSARSILDLGDSIEAGLISRSQASLEWRITPGVSEGTSGQMPLKVAVKLFSLSMEAKKAMPVKVRKQDNLPVKTITERLCTDTGRVLDAQAVEAYYEFGGNKIPLSQEEVTKVRSMDIPQGIATIGFAPRDMVVKPCYNLRACWLMRPDDKKALNSSTTLRAFLQVLKEKDHVAICCIRKRTNEVARLHALVPQSEVRIDSRLITPEGFHVVPLPYADDIRSLPSGFEIGQEGQPGGAPSRDAIDIAKRLVETVSLKKNFTNSLENGKLRNPSLLRQFAHIEACALATPVNEEDPVTDVVSAKVMLEPPDDFCTGGKSDAVRGLVEKLKQAISNSYDEDLEQKGGGKRKAPDPEAVAKKAAKKEGQAQLVAGTDWKGLVDAGKLATATMPMLTAYCKENGLRVPTRAKKQDLLEIVDKHLKDA